jgi:pullulanase
MIHLIALALVVILSVGLSSAHATTPPDSEPVVRVIVEIPERFASDDLYLAGSINAWRPDDPGFRFVVTDPDQPARRTLDLPISRLGDTDLQFKMTRGSWDTVESDSQYRNIPNRLMPSRSWSALPAGAIHEVRLTVPAFMDAQDAAARRSTVVGTLETFEFTSEVLGNSRTVRVWLPQQYGRELEAKFPVLYMHDGQNCFDEATSAFGEEWKIDEAMTEMIEAGSVPPMIVVGIDNAGADRSYEYNAPSAVFGSRQPYGDRYVTMLVDELMPHIAERYRVLGGAEHTSLGGSSFGGNITMLAAMQRPGVFGRLLIESPAVPVVGPQFLEEILEFGRGNRWTPEIEGFTGSVFLAMGTRETSNDTYNRRLVKLMGELAEAFDGERVRVVVEEGATHNERAWSARFPDAMRFLFERKTDENSD